MIKKKLHFALFLTSGFALGQGVGIGTPTPAITLDVTGKPDTATVFDGILAPRLTALQLSAKNYTTAQNGAIVYVTDNTTGTGQASKVNGTGLYTFDAITNKWVKVGTGAITGANLAAADTSLEVVSGGTGATLVASSLKVKDGGITTEKIAKGPNNTVMTTNSAGVVEWADQSTVVAEPWNVAGSTNKATNNTQNIYQMGKVGIGYGSSATDVLGANLVVRDTTGNLGVNSSTAVFRSTGKNNSINVIAENGGGLLLGINGNGTAIGDLTGSSRYIGYTEASGADIQLMVGLTTPTPKALLTAKDNGNIGIGTTIPTQKLDIGSGSLRIRDINTLAGNNLTDKMVVADNTGILKTVSNTVSNTIGTANNIGVPITTTINGVTSTTVNIPMPWNVVGGTNTATTNTQNIYQMGSVGVGTNNPVAKLEVNNGTTAGAIKIVDGTQAKGRVLTSDANGLAKWEDPRISFINGVTPTQIVNFTAGTTNNLLSGYIDLPKGLWLVNIGILIRPQNGSFIKTNTCYLARLTLSSSTTSLAQSGFSFNGSSIILQAASTGSNVGAYVCFASGVLRVNVTSATPVRLYLWNNESAGYLGCGEIASVGQNSENYIFAIKEN